MKQIGDHLDCPGRGCDASAQVVEAGAKTLGLQCRPSSCRTGGCNRFYYMQREDRAEEIHDEPESRQLELSQSL